MGSVLPAPGSLATTSARLWPTRTALMSRSSASRLLRRPVSPAARAWTGECAAICLTPAASTCGLTGWQGARAGRWQTPW